MRFEKRYLAATTTLILCSLFSFGQRTTSSIDSVIQVRTRQLSSYLSLSSSQEQAVLALTLQEEKYIDSLSRSSIQLEQKGDKINIAEMNYRRQIKTILTESQWIKYEEMLRAAQAAFMKRAAEKKIAVRNIPVQNP